AAELLAALETRDDPGYEEAIELLAELPAEELEALLGEHAGKLRRLAGDESAAARRVAVRALARTRNLENVPVLIYALGDADPGVAREARDALRRISRKPTGFDLPEQPTKADRRAAIEKWKAWYLAVRPDAEFDN
ncbi:MAG: HEAT repeat domain-containing protein, partial [Planctomycetota bacterium]